MPFRRLAVRRCPCTATRHPVKRHPEMNITLIVKPALPAVMEQLRNAASRMRAAGHAVTFLVTWEKPDLSRFAREAADGGADLVIAAGGDGTLNGIVQGLMNAAGAAPPPAVIPTGTANDFANGRGIPTDIDAAMDVALHGRATEVDIACANDRWFINVSTGGFGASAARAAGGTLKRRLGGLAYILSGARRLLRLRPERARFMVDGRLIHDGAFVFFAVANGERTGGGTLVAPRADVRDGCLDLTIVRAGSRSDFIRLLPQLRAGTHLASPDVLYTRGARIEVHSSRRLDVNLDGEPMRARAVHYVVHPRSLRLVLPEREDGPER